ncbi:aminotransferase class V-fold PLP-dependent enzyme [Pseudomonas aeruginosa]|nr:aminotransferase class V-fold PLP-dependent enzyme [Pseudomonas aeruginosa]
MAPPACRRRCSTTPSTAGWKPSGAGACSAPPSISPSPCWRSATASRECSARQPRHIALLDCASRAWSVAFAAALAAHPRIRAISSFDEYGSNSLCLLAARQQRGLELRLIDARGDAAQLLQRLDEQLHDLAPGQTPLLSLSAVPTGHGAATALEGVAERIRAHDELLFLDASHAVGQLPLAVEAIGCDVLVFPPRKWLRGPKGLGVLYLGERALERLALPDGLDVGGAQWSDACPAGTG